MEIRKGATGQESKAAPQRSHMPDHLAPGIDHHRSGSQMKVMILTEELWVIKKPAAQ